MGRIAQLKSDLEDLADELEEASQVADAPQQPEVAQARALVEEARTAVASAFLSRRALVQATETVGRAREAISAALGVSRVLRERAQALRTRSAQIMEESAEAQRERAARSWAREPGSGAQPGAVALQSAIPPGHPDKKAIEAAIVETLAAAGGHWEVWITVPATAGWWGLCVRGPSVDWVGTLQDAREQTSAAITARLAPLVRVAEAETRYRRGLRAPAGRPGTARRGGSPREL